MITSKLAANQAFAIVNRIHRGEDASRHGLGNDEVVKTPKGEAIDGIKADISAFSTHPLQQFNSDFNAVVKSIRIADKTMGEIGANVEQMESEVELFLKQYPPYPPGSEDRIRYLTRFALLRRQIDQLTLPPDAGAQKILGSSSDRGDWEIEIGGKQTGHVIRRQPLHSGGEGLALPTIGVDASDQQVRELHQALGQAKGTIRRRRGELADDATRLIRSVERML